MADLSIDQKKLPGVKEVCRDFAVLEDHALAHNLQEQEIENHLASNIQKSRLVQYDLQVAKRMQDEEDKRAWARNQRRQRDIVHSDNEIAQEIQEQLVKQALDKRQQEEKDEAIARRLHEKELKEERKRKQQLQDVPYEDDYYEDNGDHARNRHKERGPQEYERLHRYRHRSWERDTDPQAESRGSQSTFYMHSPEPTRAPHHRHELQEPERERDTRRKEKPARLPPPNHSKNSREHRQERGREIRRDHSKEHRQEHDREIRRDHSKEHRQEHDREIRRDHSKEHRQEHDREIRRDYSKEQRRDHSREHEQECDREIRRDHSKEQRRDHSREHEQERGREIRRDHSKEQRRDHSREHRQERGREIRRDHSKEQRRDHSREHRQERDREIRRDHSREQRPDHSRDSVPHRSRDASREQQISESYRVSAGPSRRWSWEEYSGREGREDRQRLPSGCDEVFHDPSSRHHMRDARTEPSCRAQERHGTRSHSSEDWPENHPHHRDQRGRKPRGEYGVQEVIQGVTRLDLRGSELSDLEVALRLQEEELKASNLDKRAVQMAHDEEIAWLLMEKEKRLHIRSRDREKGTMEMRRQEPEWKLEPGEVVRPRSREGYELQRPRSNKPTRPPRPVGDYENVDASYRNTGSHCSPRPSTRSDTGYKGSYSRQ
ncbi:serine/arginine repetitive matrix protein 5-like isoform X1 [Polyodon spathula]|uniref:serine/arginine repetitive matrix protein 5-like isoform X1 n=1 Tax=Polyodon spathula TaxID=7913 RepID=UPI001B7DEECD|nr:serine/arginine repetitive matrix protein 5-like isoform X1 [Polyodon spathula]